jgi:hypothetical protein
VASVYDELGIVNRINCHLDGDEEMIIEALMSGQISEEMMRELQRRK